MKLRTKTIFGFEEHVVAQLSYVYTICCHSCKKRLIVFDVSKTKKEESSIEFSKEKLCLEADSKGWSLLLGNPYCKECREGIDR